MYPLSTHGCSFLTNHNFGEFLKLKISYTTFFSLAVLEEALCPGLEHETMLCHPNRIWAEGNWVCTVEHTEKMLQKVSMLALLHVCLAPLLVHSMQRVSHNTHVED